MSNRNSFFVGMGGWAGNGRRPRQEGNEVQLGLSLVSVHANLMRGRWSVRVDCQSVSIELATLYYCRHITNQMHQPTCSSEAQNRKTEYRLDSISWV